MSNAALVCLLVFGLAYAAHAVPTMFQFYSYCEQVAKATGRIDENNCIWNQDEGGNNTFQREVMRKLRSGEFADYGDSVLVERGQVLARKLKHSFWGAVGLVLSVSLIEMWSK